MGEMLAPAVDGPNSPPLPHDWRITRLGEIAELASGGTPSKSRPEFWKGTIPWASPKDLKRPRLYDAEDHISEAGLKDGSRIVEPGTLFVVVRGMILARDLPVAIVKVPMAFNQDMKAVIPGPEVDGEFLLYAFQQHKPSLLPEIGTSAHGTRRISTSAIESFRFPLPPLPEQRAIAHVLRTVQRAKEATEKVVAATRQLKASLARHLFTYGPVPVDQADRVKLKETEIGAIPEHWEIKLLGELISSGPQNGLYKPESSYGSGTPILRINDYNNNGEIVESVPNRVRLTRAEIQTYSLNQGDILINRVNSLSHLGKTALVGNLSEPIVFESNMMRFRVLAGEAITEYVYRFLTYPLCRDRLKGAAKRAVAQSSINQGDVKAVAIPLPPPSERKATIEMLDALDAKVRAEASRKTALDSLFQTLLHDLMTGKLRVRDLNLPDPRHGGIAIG